MPFLASLQALLSRAASQQPELLRHLKAALADAVDDEGGGIAQALRAAETGSAVAGSPATAALLQVRA